MENKLEKLEEFKQVLASYHISDESHKILQQATLVLLTAPSSGGRNTIIRELLRTGDYHFIISDTTRHPRVNDGVPEQNGREYWFRSEDVILEDLKAGRFLEAELIHNQQVSGISIRELQKAREEQKIAITDVDLQGIITVSKAKPDTVSVLVLPPSFSEWQRRFTARGKMPSIEIRRRMETAARIFAAGLEHEYFRFVINDKVQDAAIEIHRMARLGEVDPDTQSRGRQLCEQLYIDTQAYLKSLA
jgi:guanylate kinase